MSYSGINFTKMVASGNDFVIVEIKNQKSSFFYARAGQAKIKNLQDLARQICNRKYGIGADGLLLLEKSKIADIKMRIFNPDGSEAEMCGNGIRCTAFYYARNQKKISIETKAGVIKSEVKGSNVKIKLIDPKDIKLDIPIKIKDHLLKVNFINTGVPHTVIFVEGLEKIDVFNWGRIIRKHKRFLPEGTNVDFAEIINEDSIKIRTYERGVEDETLSCGTGAVAAALILATRYLLVGTHRVSVITKSRENLRVYFDKIDTKFKNVWLEGEARRVYSGVYYV